MDEVQLPQGYRTESLWADSLLLTTKSPGVSGTNLVNLGKMKVISMFVNLARIMHGFFMLKVLQNS